MLKEFFKKHLNVIAEKCSITIAEIFIIRIKDAVSTEYEGTLNSLYDYEEADYLLERPVELFSYALGKILLIKAKKEPQNTAKVLKSLFEEELPIFTKIALFILGQNLKQEDFKDIFWNAIKNKGVKIFEGSTIYWGDELKKVLENLGPLEDTQRELLKEKIEIAADRYIESLKDKKEEEKEKWRAIFKQAIYKALSYDEEFRSLYEEMRKITKIDAELHPAMGKIEVKTGWGKSPFSVEEILKMDNIKLAEYLIQFKTVDPWEGPSVEALAETLKTAVKTDPEKFTEDLKAFLNIGYLYTAKLLEGLKEAITENKPVAYEEVLDFVEKYVDRDEFWQDKFVVKSSLPASHAWVINAFCFFVKEGFETKTYPISEQFFEKIESLIHLMIEKLRVEKEAKEISEYVVYSINTPIGHVIELYIKLVLKMLQSSYDKKKLAIKGFIEKYKELLKWSIIEAYTLFGMYLLSFYFHIEKNFTIETVNKSLKKKDETWEAFMEGYLYIGQIYKEVYELMKEHYKVSLEYNFKSELARERLIGHISIGYLIGLENLEPSSLFYKLVEKFDPDDISKIIWVLWSQRDYLKEDNEKKEQIKKRILDFWKLVYDKLKDKEELSEKEEEILSDIVRLICFLPALTEPYTDWLKMSAKFIKDPIRFSSLLEELERFKGIGDRIQTAKNIGKILLNVKPFTYPKDKIEAFIKYLYNTPDNDVKDIAKKICENYVKNGIFDFKEVCEKCG